MRIKNKFRDMRKTKYEYYQCPKCNNVTLVIRPESQLKNRNHLKSIYCYICNEDINHVKVLTE